MSEQTINRSFEDDAYLAIDAVCKEFRRRLKQHVVESGSTNISAEQVVAAAKTIIDSDWLEGFRTNEQISKAA